MKKMKHKVSLLSKQLRQGEVFVIYGAGLMGRNLLRVLKDSTYDNEVRCFIVKSKDENPDYVDGIKVISIDEADEYKYQPVFVALHEKHMENAMKELTAYGFRHLIPITFDSDLWCDVREEWLNENQMMPYGVSSSFFNHGSPELHIYVVHSEFDKKLCEVIPNHEYEISIQVGADIASKVYYTVCDNTGDNISNKNRQYCELTGLYWIWKNDQADFVGLSHYRRRFVLNDSEIRDILSGTIDMVVTVPIMNLDTVKGQYAKDHMEDDWNVMAEAIERLFPEYVCALRTVGDGNFYFAYNMFIAKRAVFNNYCSWLFSILKYCEDKIGCKDDIYQNRYPGFLAERLLTVYIVNHPELSVVVAKKHFIETKEKRWN